MMSCILSLAEVAARQQPPVNPITLLRRARKDATFPAPFKISNRWFFNGAAIEAHERQREAAA